MKRSMRRHHYARIKKKWEKTVRWSWYYNLTEDEWFPSIAARLTTTHTNCSCWMCRNDRQNEGITLQERRNLLSYNEQILDGAIVQRIEQDFPKV